MPCFAPQFYQKPQHHQKQYQQTDAFHPQSHSDDHQAKASFRLMIFQIKDLLIQHMVSDVKKGNHACSFFQVLLRIVAGITAFS